MQTAALCKLEGAFSQGLSPRPCWNEALYCPLLDMPCSITSSTKSSLGVSIGSPLGVTGSAESGHLNGGWHGRGGVAGESAVWQDRAAQATSSLPFLLPLVLLPRSPVHASTAKRPLAVWADPHSGLGGVQLPTRCHSCAHAAHQCPDPAARGGTCDQCPPAAGCHLVRASGRRGRLRT